MVLAVAIRAAVVKAVDVDALHARGGMALFVLAAPGDGGWGVGDGLHAVADDESKSGYRGRQRSENESAFSSGGQERRPTCASLLVPCHVVMRDGA